MFYSIFIDLHQFFRRLYISETTKIDIVSCQLPVRQTEWQKKTASFRQRDAALIPYYI